MTVGIPREETNEQTAANFFEIGQDVDFRKTLCGGNDLVALELR